MQLPVIRKMHGQPRTERRIDLEYAQPPETRGRQMLKPLRIVADIAPVLSAQSLVRAFRMISGHHRLVAVSERVMMNERKVRNVDEPLYLSSRRTGDIDTRRKDRLISWILPRWHGRQFRFARLRHQAGPDKTVTFDRREGRQREPGRRLEFGLSRDHRAGSVGRITQAVVCANEF